MPLMRAVLLRFSRRQTYPDEDPLRFLLQFLHVLMTRGYSRGAITFAVQAGIQGALWRVVTTPELPPALQARVCELLSNITLSRPGYETMRISESDYLQLFPARR